MAENSSALAEAFEIARKPSSHYWGFWRPEKLDINETYTVEIRLNLPDGDELNIDAIEGWTIAYRKTGMLFLRRDQSLDKAGVEALFLDALRIEVARGWRFHSWVHYPDLPDWSV